MQIDYNQLNVGGMLDKVLSSLPYPLDKNELVTQAQRAGANQQIVNAMQQALPDKTFNSPEEIKNSIQRAGQSKH
ncbi:MAG TPA: DUF2795 domain-containing protein [Ktedonobacteraceae bacterium]|jgi:hypothetical protein|nr:DUF2795 domain-containing protein [Ktedonobacteraceae bacterium]